MRTEYTCNRTQIWVVVQCRCGGAFLVQEGDSGRGPLCRQITSVHASLTHVQVPLQGARQPSQQMRCRPIWSCGLPLGAS